MQTQSKHENDYHSIDVILFILITLATLFLQFILELWHFIQSPKKSLQLLVTNPSTKKKGSSSTRQSATSRTHQREQSPALVTSTETKRESSVATGFQPETTTRQRKRTNSRVGTTSQPTKTSKSTRLTASASHLEVTK
jgi:hypothetical protein